MNTNITNHKRSNSGSAFQLMTKPIGPTCNLDCEYCYYLEKKNLFPSTKNFLMSDEVLESFIRQYIESQNGPEVNFSWQGGEPTLAGINFFKKVVDLQLKFAGNKKIGNAFQTNGLLLNDEWGNFLAEYKFFVGISIDGPEKLHDKYRKNFAGKPSFNKVMHGIELLKKYGVEFNTLTVVNDYNSHYPLDVYNFLKSVGSGYMQFIPIVERRAVKKNLSLKLIAPRDSEKAKIMPWSVNALQYGKFLNLIFDEWVRYDVGNIFVQIFDVILANWAGQDPGLCVFQEICGNATVIEHNGNLYSCDHFVYDRYLLGNILEKSLKTMMNSDRQISFGIDKNNKLPKKCLKCEFLFCCWGGCPKHRILEVEGRNKQLNYFCKGYKLFFSHVKPYMEFMLGEIKNNRTPANVMEWSPKM
ncbi:anaerobic sulfatase-maturation protein [Bacteroidota bacterium]